MQRRFRPKPSATDAAAPSPAAGDPSQEVYSGAGPGQSERLAAEEAAAGEGEEGEKAPGGGGGSSASSRAASGIDNTAAGTA